ncbi:TonB-dependent receptor plug domain-containing protein, partial [Parabacteroides sp.]
ELYKSSIPAKFGGRVSSVLDINSREGNKEKFKGSASIGLLTSSLTLEGPLFNKKTSYIVGGRTTYSDWLLNLLPEKSGYKDGNAGFYDLNASIDHRFDMNNSLTLTGYFSHDRFHFDESERYAYQNASASLKWTHAFHPNLTGTFSTGYDHYNNHTENTDNPATAYTLSFGIDQFYGKADLNWQAHDNHTVGFGLSSLYYNLNPGEYLGKGEASLVLDDRMQHEKALESAIYLGDRWDLTPALSLDVGIRYGLYHVMGPRTYNLYDPEEMPSPSGVIDTKEEGGGIYKTYQGPEFRISARYEFADGFSIKAGYHTMRQNIHKLSNTTIMSPTDTWKLSDANIKPQTGSQAAVGVYKNFTKAGLETSVEGYYKTMDNYLDYRNGANLIMNHHIETDVVNTKGRAYGVEFMVRKPNGKLNGWVSYTYSRTQLRQEDARIKKPVNRGEWYPADYDKPHDLKFVGNYKFTQRFSVSVNCDYSTGRPVSIPVSKYNFAGGEFVYFSDRNQYRIPDYFRMDLSINIEPSHHLTLLTHSTVSLGVYNVTGRDNAYSVYYVAEEGRLK